MGLLDKAKAAAEQAAAKAKEGVEDVQTKRELSQATPSSARRRTSWSEAERCRIRASTRRSPRSRR